MLDGDDTEDRVHGQQEHARYDGDDGGYGVMPLPRYAGLSGRLMTTILKAQRVTGAPMLSVLQRLGKRRRRAGPATLWMVRGDSHFASPEVMQGLDEHSALS